MHHTRVVCVRQVWESGLTGVESMGGEEARCGLLVTMATTDETAGNRPTRHGRQPARQSASQAASQLGSQSVSQIAK